MKEIMRILTLFIVSQEVFEISHLLAPRVMDKALPTRHMPLKRSHVANPKPRNLESLASITHKPAPNNGLLDKVLLRRHKVWPRAQGDAPKHRVRYAVVVIGQRQVPATHVHRWAPSVVSCNTWRALVLVRVPGPPGKRAQRRWRRGSVLVVLWNWNQPFCRYRGWTRRENKSVSSPSIWASSLSFSAYTSVLSTCRERRLKSLSSFKLYISQKGIEFLPPRGI